MQEKPPPYTPGPEDPQQGPNVVYPNFPPMMQTTVPSAPPILVPTGPPTMVPTMGTTMVQLQVVGQPMGGRPATVICSSCASQVVTRTEAKATTKTHLMAFLLFCVCCPFSCLPYLMDSCNNIDHYCPKCDAYIGTYAN